MSCSRKFGPANDGKPVVKGCVGAVQFSGTALCGTGRSITGSSGCPVRRSRTKICPSFEGTSSAGVTPSGPPRSTATGWAPTS